MLKFRRDDPKKFVELQELLGMGSYGSVFKGEILGAYVKISIAFCNTLTIYTADAMNDARQIIGHHTKKLL